MTTLFGESIWGQRWSLLTHPTHHQLTTPPNSHTGRQADSFYAGYEEEWPIPDGFEERRVIYNLYHILNHYVLFGGGYLGQAQSMMGRVLMDDAR